MVSEWMSGTFFRVVLRRWVLYVWRVSYSAECAVAERILEFRDMRRERVEGERGAAWGEAELGRRRGSRWGLCSRSVGESIRRRVIMNIMAVKCEMFVVGRGVGGEWKGERLAVSVWCMCVRGLCRPPPFSGCPWARPRVYFPSPPAARWRPLGRRSLRRESAPATSSDVRVV